MKYFGIGLIVVGVIWGVIAFNMETTVETESSTFGEGIYSIRVPSQTVHNLALADQRRNHLIGAGIALISGILLLGFGSMQTKEQPVNSTVSSEKKCPSCAEYIKLEAIKCRFCGHEFNPDTVAIEMNEIERKREHFNKDRYESMAIKDLHLAALECYSREDYNNFLVLRNIISTKYPNSREYKMLLDYSVKGKA